MPGLLDRITPEQRKLLAYGIPAVALLALGLRLGRSGQPTTAADTPVEGQDRPTGLLAPITSGGATDVLGVGQLADFESVVTGTLGSLIDQVKAIGEKEPPAPTTTPPPPPARPAPIYPTFYPNPSGPGSYGPEQCPAGRVPVAGATGWSCVTPAELAAIAAYVGGRG